MTALRVNESSGSAGSIQVADGFGGFLSGSLTAGPNITISNDGSGSFEIAHKKRYIHVKELETPITNRCHKVNLYEVCLNLFTNCIVLNKSLEVSPTSMLLFSAQSTNDSVAKLAPEPGENGQPPKPPILESNSLIPC